MATIEEKLKALRQAAKEKSSAVLVEEEIGIPVDIDKDRFSEIAKGLAGTKANPVIGVDFAGEISVIDTLPDVEPDEPEIEEIPDDLPDEFADETPVIDDEEEEENIPEEFDAYQGTPLPTIPDAVPSSPSQLRALVISVTTLPFIPAKQVTQGEPPVATQKYHILVEVARPLQVGKEYQINL